MRVIITGGTGLLGTALTKSLTAEGHKVVILSRSARHVRNLPLGAYAVQWDAKTEKGWVDHVDHADAIINLAGSSIAGSGLGDVKWTDERKASIMQSRIDAGAAVVAAVKASTKKPDVVIQASGVGFYGDRADELLTEESAAGEGFPAEVTKKWEPSTAGIDELGVRRVIARIGVVLSNQGGALPQILMPFKMMAGGPIGSGKQYFSWVHMDDVVSAMRFFITNKETSGVYNLTSPGSVTNKEFAKAAGSVLKRPSFMPTPAFAMQALMGEASALLLESQRVAPTRLTEAGFTFAHTDAQSAVQDILDRDV